MTTYSTAFSMGLPDQRLDAIVVPTNRSSECLSYALTLAERTNAFLLVLYSGRASATAVANRLVSYGVRGLAVDVPVNYRHPLLLDFETDNFSDAMLGRSANDISLKRNLGLIVGRMAGWSKLLLLDDDITSVEGLVRAISLAADEPVAGFLVGEFPDNSVVRHAERLSGVEPGVRLNAGALVINTAAIAAFFPHIYSEDWFFLCGMGHGTFCSTAAGTAIQRRYDPFEPSRAASEEFGDLLAEGILQLTDAGHDLIQSSESDWRHLLADRKLLISRICKKLEAQVAEYAAVKSLLEAKARLNDIAPQTCVAYIAAWNHDLELFRKRFALLSYQGASITQIVEAAGLQPARPTLAVPRDVF